jgi:prepilin-type N-terminal cleavage/methylation domain-containing protein
MKRLIRQSENKAGFTIVELLTVMSIIVILIGLLVPALNAARRYASNVKQEAQFHSIDAALELFKNDFGDYPDSSTAGKTPDTDEGGIDYPGAARLCEALVGQDLLGFNPSSHFRADCTDGSGNNLYGSTSAMAANLYPSTITNLQSRKGPYLPLEKANAYKFSDIYGSTATALTQPLSNDFVLCDEYSRVKNATTGKRIGMPILYYKANTAGTIQDPNNLPAGSAPYTVTGGQQFYDYRDNDYLLSLGVPWNSSVTHPMYSGNPGGPKIFYMDIQNPQISLPAPYYGRPYRSDSYILMSAGYDGLYGTADDVFNF